MKKENLREMYLSSGKLVIAGKNAHQNEEVVKNSEAKELVFHTASPGSPFCVIKDSKKASNKDIYESALFCAKYSREWKKSKKKKNISVHVFLGEDIYKDNGMALGTFGVKKFKKINAKKGDIEKFK